MKKKINLKNRLGIFVIYDQLGIIGGYRKYLLEDMVKNLTELVIVCNGNILESEIGKLTRFTKRIFIRKNQGFDAAAIRCALCEYIGWDEMRLYNELVIFNDSFYGPLYPFKVMFDEMDTRDADFWGITGDERGKETEHIQSYFYVIRKKMLCSNEFRDYWMKLDTNYVSLMDAILKYEFKFTHYFASLGFKWDLYIDTSEFKRLKINNMQSSHKLLSNYKLPIIKRKPLIGFERGFNGDIWPYFIDERAMFAMEYIKKHTIYDINLIWDDLLRRNSIPELIKDLSLYYILPKDFTARDNIARKKIAAAIRIDNNIFFEDYIKYFLDISDFIDIYVYVTDVFLKSKLINRFSCEKCTIKVELIEKEQCSICAFPEFSDNRLSQYEYVCFLNDVKKETESMFSAMIASHNFWHNMLISREFISNVINTFEDNPRLGLLMPTIPPGENYLKKLRMETKQAIQSVQPIAKMLGLSVNLTSLDYSCLNTTSFWCRPTAFRMLFECGGVVENYYQPIDAEKMLTSCIYPYVAQHEGYYTGIVMSDQYARLELSNKATYISAVQNRLDNDLIKINNIVTLDDAIRSIHNTIQCTYEIIRDKRDIFLYGTGEYGTHYFNVLEKQDIPISGFIVSDGHKHSDSFLDCPVYEITEILDKRDRIYVIIAVGEKNRHEVRKNLKINGFVNVLN